ncbi:hypothetical protein [Paracoccus beibuensis]|uniref:hypothetical protein n=1 Tax=Paracoccus beibuensis TaxID=547602 RepID=UPI00223F59A4|nr:hypothetical protein [Paracoccus beibuensis]
MTRYLIAGALLLSLAGFGWFQTQRAGRLADQLDAADAQLVEYARVAEIQRQSIKRLQAIAEDSAALDREFQEGEGADAPLSDTLRSGAGRLWP